MDILNKYPNEGENAARGDLKASVARGLEENDLEAVAAMAWQHRSVLGILMRLAYDKESLVGWRAILAIGRIARIFLETQYEFLRTTVRKLLWMLSDESGGIGWSAPEILGEIVGADPERFSDIVPLIAELFFIEEQVFRPGVLYAMMRIAEKSPESVIPFRDIVIHGLRSQDAVCKIYALELVRLLNFGKRMDSSECQMVLSNVELLANSTEEAWIYNINGFIAISLGEKARETRKYLKSDG